MLKIDIKPLAESDLEKIFLYTFNTWGLKQAEKYQDELFLTMNEIAKDPTRGQSYPYSNLSYRKIRSNKHLIFYRSDSNSCEIVRVLHERMDLKSKLSD